MNNTKSTSTALKKMMILALTAFVATFAVSMVSATSNGLEMEQDMERSRRLVGGYSESFCERTLADCCTPNDEGLYPNCRCPKRRKGGLDDPICLFGICTGSYTQICAECTERFPTLVAN